LGRFLRFADSLYLGVLDGTLDKRLWRGYERTIADTVAYPGFQTWWATRKHWHTDEFCALIDRHIQTAKPKIYDRYTQASGSVAIVPAAQKGDCLPVTYRLRCGLDLRACYPLYGP